MTNTTMIMLAFCLLAFGSATVLLLISRGRTRDDLHHACARARGLDQEIERATENVAKLAAQLVDERARIEALEAELRKRPSYSTVTYNIVNVGLRGSGKTRLTLKWANPLFDIGDLRQTDFEHYRRTVSRKNAEEGAIINYDFDIFDYGGERIADALATITRQAVHALLLVVDVGDDARIEEQLENFNRHVLRLFLGTREIAKNCRTVVLFINKTDLFATGPDEAERLAREKYASLIRAIEEYGNKNDLDIRVIAGSAASGHHVQHLFAHFIERILPKTAYDEDLLQQMAARPRET